MSQLSLASILFFFVAAKLFAATAQFDQALDILVNADSQVERAKLANESAKEALSKSKQAYLPEVSASSSWNRQTDVDETFQDAKFEGSFNIFKFGQDRAVQNARSAEYEASLTALKLAKAKSSWDASLALFEVLSAKQQLDAENKYIDLKKSSLAITQKLFKNGSRPAQDVEKLTLDVLSEEDRAQKLEVSFQEALAKVKSKAPQLDLVHEWPWTKILLNINPEKQKKLIESGFSAESKMAESVVLAKQSEITEKRSFLFPTVDLEGRYGWEKFMSEEKWKPRWLAQLVIRMPIYQKGTNYYGLHEAQRELKKADFDRAEAEQRFIEAKDTALKHLNVAVATFKNKEALTKRVQNLYNQSLNAFGRGMLSVNDLLDDQSRLVKAELDVAEATSEAHKAAVKFCKVYGYEVKECVGGF